MNPAFRDMFEGLRQTADALIAANEGIKRVAEAALRASAEHEDLRETVQRLESLIMAQGRQLTEQGREIRTLRDELTRRRNGNAGS
jgi:hypothetical protein